MNRYVKTALLAGAAWSALSTFAVAQDAPAAQSAALDDVIVTARRTEESAQRTPLSLSAFSGESLNQAGATQTTDLQLILLTTYSNAAFQILRFHRLQQLATRRLIQRK